MNILSDELDTIEKLYLLALDDDKGTFVSNSMVFGYCIAGAVLFELSESEKIRIVDKKVSLINTKKLNHQVLDEIIDLISSSDKTRSTQHWIEKIADREAKIRASVLGGLIDKGILEQQENKVLFFFTVKKYPTKNAKPENAFRKRLNDIISNHSKPDSGEAMLISLIDACELNKEVYGKEAAKQHAKRIKEVIKEFQLEHNTGKVIKEIQETLIALMVVLMASTTITISS